MEKLRNFIEVALGKQIKYISGALGIRGGRKYYEITFKDDTTRDYFIDFDNKTLEEA